MTEVVTGENSQVADTQTVADPAATSTLLTEAVPSEVVDSTTQQPAEEKPVEGAPETYEFVAPEGQQFDTAVIDTFSGLAKELNLPQDKAQLVLDKMAPVIAQRQIDRIAEVHEQWANETRSDKELGGDRLNESMAIAKRGLYATATPALRELLDKSGFGNHPEVIRHFYQVGKSISQDTVVTAGQSTSAGQGKQAADVLYDKS